MRIIYIFFKTEVGVIYIWISFRENILCIDISKYLSHGLEHHARHCTAGKAASATECLLRPLTRHATRAAAAGERAIYITRALPLAPLANTKANSQKLRQIIVRQTKPAG